MKKKKKVSCYAYRKKIAHQDVRRGELSSETPQQRMLRQ
jgi:hypothetical protein